MWLAKDFKSFLTQGISDGRSVMVDDHGESVLRQGELFAEEASGCMDLCMDYGVPNKRAVGLLPMPGTDDEQAFAWTQSIDPQKLLAHAEIARFSGILRIFCDQRRVRAAMLFFKGLVIGCMYTRELLPDPLFDENACSAFIDELFEAGGIIHAYRLEPELVLASSAALYSVARTTVSNLGNRDKVLDVLSTVLGNLQTGSVIFHSAEGALAIAYVRLGVIIDFYSYLEGWCEPTVSSIADCLEKHGEIEILVNTLSIFQENDFACFTIRPAYLASRRSFVLKRRMFLEKNRSSLENFQQTMFMVS